MDVDFSTAEKALASLALGLSKPPQNELERDGVIQRFEYCFEAIWKLAKRVLNFSGIPSTSPRSVIRDLAQQGHLQNAEIWMVFLEARNYTSHTYNQSVALWVFSQCPFFLTAAQDLIEKLKNEVAQ